LIASARLSRQVRHAAQAAAGQFQRQAVGGLADDEIRSAVGLRDGASVGRDRPFEFQVRQAMVGKRLGRDRQVDGRLARQGPGPQHGTHFDHEVPVQRTLRAFSRLVAQDDKAGRCGIGSLHGVLARWRENSLDCAGGRNCAAGGVVSLSDGGRACSSF